MEHVSGFIILYLHYSGLACFFQYANCLNYEGKVCMLLFTPFSQVFCAFDEKGCYFCKSFFFSGLTKAVFGSKMVMKALT